MASHWGWVLQQSSPFILDTLLRQTNIHALKGLDLHLGLSMQVLKHDAMFPRPAEADYVWRRIALKDGFAAVEDLYRDARQRAERLEYGSHESGPLQHWTMMERWRRAFDGDHRLNTERWRR